MENLHYFHGWAVYGNSNVRLPKANIIITSFDPWVTTDVIAGESGYWKSEKQFEAGISYQIHMRGPYYDYPSVLYSPESTCPLKFYWKPPTQEDIDSMWEYYNIGDFSNDLLNYVITLGSRIDKMEEYINKWQTWLNEDSFPLELCARYYGNNQFINLLEGSNPKVDVEFLMAGDIRKNKLG